MPEKRPDRPVRKRKGRGIAPVKRGRWWHAQGTLRVKGQSIRVRQALGLPVDGYDEAQADIECTRIANDIVDQAVHGIKPGRDFAEAALDWLERPRSRRVSPTDHRNTTALGLFFRRQGLSIDIADITPSEIDRFIADRARRDNGRATIERYLNTLNAILRREFKAGRLAAMPYIDRDETARNRPPAARVRDALPLEDIGLLIGCAAPHMKPILAAMAATGARVSALLRVPEGDLVLSLGRGRMIQRQTKNDNDVVSELPDWTVRIIAEHVRGLRDRYRRRHQRDRPRDLPVFVTRNDAPYADFGGKWGGQIKTAVRGARRRAADRLEAEAKKTADDTARADLLERAARLRRATPHWLRHSLATHMQAHGADVKSVMEQGGWDDPRMVMAYAKRVDTRVRTLIEALDFDTTLTQPPATKQKKRERSKG